MLRFDAVRIEKFERTPQGGLKIPGNLTRVGIFEYRQPDGTVRRELRPAEEVFKQDHMQTFQDSPVTIGHPGLVSPKNWKKVSVGHISSNVKEENGFVTGDIIVQDEAAVKAIEDGKLKELSCGYQVDLDMTPGTWEGQPYDAIQRNIRGNHVALLPVGKARGGKDVALRLDSNDDEVLYTSPDMEENKLRQDEIDGLKGQIEAFKAQNDALSAQVATLTASLNDTARLDALVSERVELVTQVKSVVKDLDPCGKTNRALKELYIATKTPKVRLDAVSDEFVNAAFAVASSFELPHPSLGAVRQDATNVQPAVNALAEAQKRNTEAASNAWKQVSK